MLGVNGAYTRKWENYGILNCGFEVHVCVDVCLAD
jgi:hypothetical protein